MSVLCSVRGAAAKREVAEGVLLSAETFELSLVAAGWEEAIACRAHAGRICARQSRSHKINRGIRHGFGRFDRLERPVSEGG
jgi:hypothetical protein